MWPVGDDGKPRIVLFVSGPMAGTEERNRHLFESATQKLREKGYWVRNPARQPIGLKYAEYAHRAVKDVYRSDGLAMLPGWELSPGASREHHIATKLGLECRDLDAWESIYQREPQLT